VAGVVLVDTTTTTTTNTDLVTAAAVVDEFETQSQADPTGFHVNVLEVLSAAPATAPNEVDEFETQSLADPTGFRVNVMEVNGIAQTANDNGADINSILDDTATIDTPGEIATAVWNAAAASYGGVGTYGQLAEDTFDDTDAYDTDLEHAAAIWNSLTATYGGAGTYGQAAEDVLAGVNVTAVGGDAIADNNDGRLEVNVVEWNDVEVGDLGVEIPTAVWSVATSAYGGEATYGQAVEDMLADTAAYDTDAEYAAAIWNALTATYGGAGTYGAAAEADATALVKLATMIQETWSGSGDYQFDSTALQNGPRGR